MTVQLYPTTRPTSAARDDCPAVPNDSTDLSCPRRLSSCTQRLDRPQLPATTVQLYPTTRPTSAARDDCPASTQRLDRPQLPATTIQRYPTTRPNLSLLAPNIQLYLLDSTYASYPRRTSSCEHLQRDYTS